MLKERGQVHKEMDQLQNKLEESTKALIAVKREVSTAEGGSLSFVRTPPHPNSTLDWRTLDSNQPPWCPVFISVTCSIFYSFDGRPLVAINSDKLSELMASLSAYAAPMHEYLSSR